MPNSSHIEIDYKQIPPADLKNLCRTLTAAMIEFYKDPKNIEGFERWQRERMKNKEVAHNACNCS